MRRILEDIFYGNICPGVDGRMLSKDAREVMKHVVAHQEALNETLTERQKEIFEKFSDCYTELLDINEREIFVYAFRLGAKITIEVLFPDAE